MTAPTEAPYKPSRATAKRGDLVLMEQHNRYTYQHPGEGPRTVTAVEYDLHQITSVTREGAIKATRDRWPHTVATPFARLLHVERWAVIPAEDVDAESLWAEACTHTWPEHDTQPMRWDSRAEVTELIKRHRV
jgi:hypothetical protein